MGGFGVDLTAGWDSKCKAGGGSVREGEQEGGERSKRGEEGRREDVRVSFWLRRVIRCSRTAITLLLPNLYAVLLAHWSW